MFDELEQKYFDEVKSNGLDQVQIIAPYKKGNLGTLNLNKFISTFNKYERTETGYAVSDKVMQIRNDYGSGIFNGECGTVALTTANDVYVNFNENSSMIGPGTDSTGLIHYEEKNLSDLILAYASTCHKSQGAEYSVVFVILDDSVSDFLLTRKLLYTAVSRGKKKVYIYSTPGGLSKCIRNTSEVPRITKLCALLQEANVVTSIEDHIEEIPF